jgi:hypothetical protein
MNGADETLEARLADALRERDANRSMLDISESRRQDAEKRLEACARLHAAAAERAERAEAKLIAERVEQTMAVVTLSPGPPKADDPNYWEWRFGHMLRERDAAIERAERAENACTLGVMTVANTAAERDAAIGRAETAEALLEKNEGRVKAIVDDTLIRERDAARAEAAALREAAVAYRKLTICYRLGRPPSEALHRELEKAGQTLDGPDG